MPDYPDFTSQINIVAQALEHLTIRQKYGAASRDHDATICYKDSWQTLLDLTGKGFFYAGLLKCIDPDVYFSDQIRITIDGEEIANVTWEDIYGFKLFQPNLFPIWLVAYNVSTPLICASVTQGYTFESSYLLEYYHKSTSSCIIIWDMVYANIL